MWGPERYSSLGTVSPDVPVRNVPAGTVDHIRELYGDQWNWGAFFWNWLWLVAHRQYVWAIPAFLLNFVPFGGLAISIWLGMHGSELALEKRRFSGEPEFVAVQNAWRNWGFVVCVLLCLSGLSLAWLVINRAQQQ